MTTLPTFMTLIIGLILTAATTYMVDQYQQHLVYNTFTGEAESIHRQVETALDQSRRYQTLCAQLIAYTTPNMTTPNMTTPNMASLPPGNNPQINLESIAQLEIIQSTDSGYVQIALPEPLSTLAAASSLLLEPTSQASLDQAVKSGVAVLLSPRINTEELTTTQAKITWLLALKQRIYSVSSNLSELLAGTEKQLSDQSLKLMLFDLKRYSSDPFLVLNAPEESGAKTLAGEPQWHYQNPLQNSGGEWLLKIVPRTDFTHRFDYQFALIIFLGGTVISLLLTSLVSLKRVSR